MDYGFVYIWRDRKYGMFYIGCHWGNENDGYICSSSWMMKSYKRRPQDFKRRMLTKIHTNKKDLLEEEFKWLSLIKQNELHKKYYNLHNHHFNHWTADDKKLSICEKISANTKESMWKSEVREKYLNGLKNRDMSYLENESYKGKRSELGKRNKGRKHEGQALENMRAAAKTRKQNKEALSLGGTSACNIINTRKVKCIKCGFESNPGVIGKYHNEKCKKSCIQRIF